MSTSSSSPPPPLPTWSQLQSLSLTTPIGSALQTDLESRQSGHGSPHVSNTLRLFSSSSSQNNKPQMTLYRDHAGWCPYCEKTMLLIEEKQIPINIRTVPMRSYGDKPNEFLKLVPSGLLPALVLDENKQVITESQVIMTLLDQWHPPKEGYKAMMPETEKDERRYDTLARLERELFSWWCTLIFRPEGGPTKGGFGGIVTALTGGASSSPMSGAMKSFLECLARVDSELASTSGPWFFDSSDHPTMIDLIFVSHVERMLASCAYWKGLIVRDETKFPAICTWLDAFDRRDCYLAFKSDFYTNVMDIPPQYGPGYFGGFVEEQEVMAKAISGRDGTSWNLPLPHDDPLQPLYKGPPLPVCALEAVNLHESYQTADPDQMAEACRHAAGWKLASNGSKVSQFASRGGPTGSQNPRKTFGAELADPYAQPDETIVDDVDAVLRCVCDMLLLSSSSSSSKEPHEAVLERDYTSQLQTNVPPKATKGVIASLEYLRDRVGVPRDMPLAAARQFRAHLNWAIDVLRTK